MENENEKNKKVKKTRKEILPLCVGVSSSGKAESGYCTGLVLIGGIV